MAEALRRLEGAREVSETGRVDIAVGAAYYAMLYAARAALSEEGLYAKTHQGTWTLFARTFVLPGRFDRDLARRATAAQEVREDADYEAAPPTSEQAQGVLADAEGFVAAVERMLGSR